MRTAFAPALILALMAGFIVPAHALPAKGEIQLDGQLQIVDVPHRRLSLRVTSFTLPSGKSSKLPRPKVKTVSVDATAIVEDATGKSGEFGPGAIFEWSVVSIVGKDTGSAATIPASHIKIVKSAVLEERQLPDIGKTETDSSELSTAATFGFDDEVQKLLNNGADVNEQDKTGYTALMLAAGTNKLSTINLLLQAGADPNLFTTNGDTALTTAVALGNKDVVKALLAAKAEADPVSKTGATPLILALGMDQTEIAQALIEAGADPNKRTLRNITPLAAARRVNNEKIVSLLLAKGARE